MAAVTDPVCGMTFEAGEAAAQTNYKGVPYYFCSEDCRKTFEENPDEFVSEANESPDQGD